MDKERTGKMEYLVIYDETGFILSQAQGSELREPVGVPFLWVEIPTGKVLNSIDVLKTPNVPIFKDIENPNATLELLIQQLQEKLSQTHEESMTTTLTLMQALAEVYEKFLALQVKTGGTI
ncbi:MAG TPA: hypothetical protein VHP38_16080 [Ruminiclostridium sp.]|nr:hypothetical protein [Ruminiclostridium sp.]